MTERLYKGMFSRDLSHLFGLRHGQFYGNYTIKNAGWYNRAGEKLGQGDLTLDEMATIELTLADDTAFAPESDEIFIVLHEYPSYLDFRDSDLDEQAPGIDYVAEHATYIITKEMIYRVDQYGTESYGTETCCRRTGKSYEVTVLTREDARKLLVSMADAV